MNRRLSTAYRTAGEAVPAFGRADRAIVSARRRRARLAMAVPAAAGALVVAVFAVAGRVSTDSNPPPATHSIPAVVTSTAVTPPEHPTPPAATLQGPVLAPGSLVYRRCDGPDCRITVVFNNGPAFDLASERPDLAQLLASRGLDGVTLSPDGSWIGVPDGREFTLYDMFGDTRAIDLPVGPEGTRWQASYWNVETDLVLVHFAGDTVTDYAVVHPNRAAAEARVTVIPAPTDEGLLPDNVGSAYYDILSLEAPVDTSTPVAERERVTIERSRTLIAEGSGFEPVGLSPPGAVRDLSACMSDAETLAGPAGVPVIYVAAPATSTDQSGSTLAFTVHDGSLIPTAVIRGSCDGGSSPPPGERRYELPQSSNGTTWTFLGVVDHKRSLMGRQDSGSSSMKLVEVGYLGPAQVVGEVPANAEVLLPGMTIGSLDPQ